MPLQYHEPVPGENHTPRSSGFSDRVTLESKDNDEILMLKSGTLLLDSDLNFRRGDGGHLEVTTAFATHITQTDKELSNSIDIEMAKATPLIYKVSENPPLHLCILFALQQVLVSIAPPLVTAFVVCEVACGSQDDSLKLRVLASCMFMIGLSTFCMSTFGLRLPIFQGPTVSYLLPLLALQSLEGWKCPRTFHAFYPEANMTILMADIGNGSYVPNREIALERIAVLSGCLLAVGGMHFLIGASGLVGVVVRFIGPVTIVPTLLLFALQLYSVLVKFCQTDWLVSAITTCIPIILSLCLAKHKTPIPLWTKSKGLHILWYPIHQILSLLIAMIIGYILSAILTSAGYYSDDPSSGDYLARSDARLAIISQADWFMLPHAGRLGHYSFSVGVFICFVMATAASVLDSVGDYVACARAVQVPHPPAYAVNRGLAVEGLMAVVCGFLGACHATVSHGANIGVIGISKVASRQVFQVTGLIYILLAVIGKLGAVFVTIPYPVLGGTTLVSGGIFAGLLLSHLQNIDLNSVRNLTIIGTTLMLGMTIPSWSLKNSHTIDTGSKDLDGIINMLLSNPVFVGGVFSAALDNVIPGTLKERGLLAQMQDLTDADDQTTKYEDGPEVYRLPFLSNAFRRSRFARWVPLFDVKYIAGKR